MFLEKLEKVENFTSNEKIIAQYILDNPFELGDYTAEDLANKTFTSKASVFRFCRKIGATGFDKFKHQVVMEATERKRLNELLKQEPIKRDSSTLEIFNIVPIIYEKALSETRMKLNADHFNEIIHKIHQADVIDIYCSGITQTIAEAAKFKLDTLGLTCNLHTGINEHYIMANNKKSTVAILLSFTGMNQGIINTAQYLKDTNQYLLGMGGIESDSLKMLCHDYLEIHSQELILSMEFINPYISMTYLFDLIFTSLMVLQYDEHLKHSYEVINKKNIG